MSDCGCKVEGHTNIEIHDPRFSPSRIPDALTGRDGIAPVELFPGVWVKIVYCPKHAAKELKP